MNENPLTCKRCHAPVEETDNYCRVCGHSLKPGRGFLFTHAGIILMALILGPFALPLVWMSKIISNTAKIIYTLVLLVAGYYFVLMCVQTFQLVQDSMRALTNL